MSEFVEARAIMRQHDDVRAKLRRGQIRYTEASAAIGALDEKLERALAARQNRAGETT